MATPQAGMILRHLGKLMAGQSALRCTDRQLLARFIATRDEAAFTALVQRHGPMVLGVGRRVLHHLQDAEDVFQATFLILARKAGSVRRKQSIGAWLYQVAYHLAIKAKINAEKRAKHERREVAMSSSNPMDQTSWQEVQRVLDEELQKLPEQFRAVLVLCHLEGMTQEDAASQLGWSKGTLRRRLGKARELLRARLIGRGLTLPAALAVSLAEKSAVHAAVPSALVGTTVRAAAGLAAGKGMGTLVTARVVTLVETGLRTILTAKIKAATAILVSAGLVICGAGAVTHQLLARPQSDVAIRAHSSVPHPEAVRNPAQAQQESPPISEQDKEKMTVTGQVVDAGNEPVANAQVAVVGRPRRQYGTNTSSEDYRKVLAQGSTDKEGRFHLAAPRTSSARFFELDVIASAEAHGVGWRRLNPDAAQPRATITLPPEQILRGRLVDLQGQPLGGVHVSVSAVGKSVNGMPEGVSLDGKGKLPLAWPKSVVTDPHGRFEVRGINRDRGLRLRAENDRIGHQSLGIGQNGERQLEEMTISLAPPRVLEGRVLYEDSGKPIRGARILDALSDERGRFRITLTTDALQELPYPDHPHLHLNVVPPHGEPCLGISKWLPWPKGALKHSVDFKLPRGLLVRGKVSDRATGQPIAGAGVQYWPQEINNPNYRSDISSGWQAGSVTGPDGAFEIAVLPGPCHLLVQGPTLDYVHEEISSGLLQTGQPEGTRFYPDAALRLDVPRDGLHKEVNITLRKGVSVRGRLVGPDGQAIGKAIMLNRLYVIWDLVWHLPVNVHDGEFEIHGCDPDKSYSVYFLDPVNQWAATALIFGKDADKSLTVRLVPCGKALVRYVDTEKKPLANIRLYPNIVLTPGEYRLMPGADGLSADEAAVINIDRHNYWNARGSDAEGHVTFPALIPGATYRLMRLEKNRFVVHKEFVAESGKTLDLGEMVIQSSR